MIVISDTSPIRYLCQIGRIDILPAIFGSVVVPNAVAAELSREATPQAARDLIGNPPGWLHIRAPSRPTARNWRLWRRRIAGDCIGARIARRLLDH